PASLAAAYVRLTRLLVSRLDWDEVTVGQISRVAAEQRAETVLMRALEVEEQARKDRATFLRRVWLVAATLLVAGAVTVGALYNIKSNQRRTEEQARSEAILSSAEAEAAKDPLTAALLLAELKNRS